ncbi:EAL domain-containing protein [Aliikangiella sp. IMCC44359]|uniref:EAL domain-containing protein n=1 Tax=Aliikangiella sp. IMCC44359 TaxID=3459125 RepID=UPI00403B313E
MTDYNSHSEAKVLFVSHSDLSRQNFKQEMRLPGIDICLSPNLQQALEAVKVSKYSLVVVEHYVFEENSYSMNHLSLIDALCKYIPSNCIVLLVDDEQEENIHFRQLSTMDLQIVYKPCSQSKLLDIFKQATASSHLPSFINLKNDAQGLISTDFDGLKLLLLEDNYDDADLVQECWSEWDAEGNSHLTHYDRLSSALEALEKEEFSLILSDLNLPDSQGLDTVSSLLAVTNIPIIVLTGDEDEHRAIAAMTLGIQDYVSKSELDSNSLRRSVHYAIEREKAHQEYSKLLNNNPDGIVVLDEHGKVLFANEAAGRLFGCTSAELTEETFGYPIGGGGQNAVEIQSCAGYYLEMNVVNMSWKGHPAHIVSLRDITQHKKLQEQLIYNANHDPLTGLANRTLLAERLSQAINNSQRSSESLAIMMLDLDRFKLINDSMGHDVGDSLLRECAVRLKAALRKSDTLARTGGDEFVIVLQYLGEIDSVTGLASKILARMEKPFILAGKSFSITTSIGIACYPKDGENASSLLKNADVAMYRSKEAGRNCFQVYDADLHQQSMQRLTLESELKQALLGKQFELHYQPQHSLSGLASVEALLRWRHPTKGLLPPADFIPLLQKTGLIREVEVWIMHTALNHLKHWHQTISPSLRMAINISASTLQNDNLYKQTKQLLSYYEIPAHCLEIEITESVLLNHTEIASQVLNELKAMGVDIAMDDFGTGYSSLSYLLEFPAFSTLKIDRSFTMKLETDERARSVMGVILELAHALNMRVVAEGIETQGQFQLLKQKNCDLYQGYLFSKPLPIDELEKYFRQKRQISDW